MVRIAVSSENVALAALERVMVAVSFDSIVASAKTGTLKVPDV